MNNFYKNYITFVREKSQTFLYVNEGDIYSASSIYGPRQAYFNKMTFRL